MSEEPREFFPLKCWDELRAILLDEGLLKVGLARLSLDGAGAAALAGSISRVFAAAERKMNLNTPWVEVQEAVGPASRVQAVFIPEATRRKLDLTLDMARPTVGLEPNLKGVLPGSPAFKCSFIVGQLPGTHPLGYLSRRQSSGTVAVTKVFQPPLELPAFGAADSAEGLSAALLHQARSVHFAQAERFAATLRECLDQADALTKKALVACCSFLEVFAGTPARMRARLDEQLAEVGASADPELSLAFLRCLKAEFAKDREAVRPPRFAERVEALLQDDLGRTLGEVLRQLARQQSAIRDHLREHGGLEQDRERIARLKAEMEQMRRSDAREELLRRSRQELERLQDKVQRSVRRYQTALGIVLVHELYVDSLAGAEDLAPLVRGQRDAMEDLRAVLMENDVSAQRDLARLAEVTRVRRRKPRPGAREPRSAELETVGRYETGAAGEILAGMPAASALLDPRVFTAEDLLDAFLKRPPDAAARKVFDQHALAAPQGLQQARLVEHVRYFLAALEQGLGLDVIHRCLLRDVERLEAVVRHATATGRLDDLLRKDLAYFRRFYADPYRSVLERKRYAELAALVPRWQRLDAALATPEPPSYAAEEERALLHLFRHVVRQLARRDLFRVGEFTSEIRGFMTAMRRHRDAIGPGLMERILRDYTVFLMGCSRLSALSDSRGALGPQELEEIRRERSRLV